MSLVTPNYVFFDETVFPSFFAQNFRKFSYLELFFNFGIEVIKTQFAIIYSFFLFEQRGRDDCYIHPEKEIQYTHWGYLKRQIIDPPS
jgi:hypothetical protein